MRVATRSSNGSEISPTYAWAHGLAGFTLLSMGEPDAALRRQSVAIRYSLLLSECCSVPASSPAPPRKLPQATNVCDVKYQ